MVVILGRTASAAAAMAMIAAPHAASSAASEPRVFTPTSPWNLDYADESCALTRAFADSEAEILLEMRQYSPADDFQVTVATKGKIMRSLTKSYRFSQGEPWRDTVPVIATFKGGIRAAVFSTALLPISQQKESLSEGNTRPLLRDKLTAPAAEISELEVRNFFWRHAKLEFDQFGPAMAAMRNCMDELLTHWDIDAEAHKTLSRRATFSNPEDWMSYITRNYPIFAVVNGLEGPVRIRLAIDEQGSPTDCTIQRRFSGKKLEETACEGMMRYARFEPALDKDSNPIASYYATQFVFRFR